MNRKAKAALVCALVVVVAMAFRVSWNALRDIAKAIGADDVAATLYPFVVDGLMALALVAALVLVGTDRRFALRVLAGYTLASLVLNYVHGLLPELHGESIGWSRLADGNLTNWALVLLATSLPVGSIYFGSDLVAKVLHHRPPIEPNVQESTQTDVNRSMDELGEPVVEEGPDPAAFEPVPVDVVDVVVDPVEVRVPVAAAEVVRPRRATGRVPEVARSARPVRTPEELLAEARSITEAWSIEDLTGERIRKALRTSPAKARMLRETLKAERAANATAEAVAG
ncbi:DUF2637 domain-containing protein [Streptomyces vinaceus]|uniref:DUF2637 domain-containing protein n=1 Tax=Streptomyces vinaceus TaxID=1960 RepID=A0A5J6J873_STRVI|nr:DUF2637 domain-containing protein [Streptomyces vinaceus]QEV46333.1 DUF2637 domain-containing protein [Streptomyces vinaceus]GHE65850.1 hypothetical protein GCM10017778_58420 [Streptomyces vinaceus]